MKAGCSSFLAFLALSGLVPVVQAKDKEKTPLPPSAVICDAEHLGPIFDKKDRAGCLKAFNDTANLGCSSGQEFAALLAAKKTCLRANLDRIFDERTAKSREESPTAFKKETDIHVAFLKGAEKLCHSSCTKGDPTLWQTYNENCLGNFYTYRMNQVEAMNTESLELPPVRASKNYNGVDRVKSAFDSYAKLMCKLPGIWKDKKAAKDCEKRFYNQITIEFEVHKDPCDLS